MRNFKLFRSNFIYSPLLVIIVMSKKYEKKHTYMLSSRWRITSLMIGSRKEEQKLELDFRALASSFVLAFKIFSFIKELIGGRMYVSGHGFRCSPPISLWLSENMIVALSSAQNSKASSESTTIPSHALSLTFLDIPKIFVPNKQEVLYTWNVKSVRISLYAYTKQEVFVNRKFCSLYPNLFTNFEKNTLVILIFFVAYLRQ